MHAIFFSALLLRFADWIGVDEILSNKWTIEIPMVIQNDYFCGPKEIKFRRIEKTETNLAGLAIGAIDHFNFVVFNSGRKQI